MKNLVHSIAVHFLLGLVLFFEGCDYSNHMLRVHNGSSIKISVLYSNNKKGSTENLVDFYTSDYNIIHPKDTSDIIIGGKKNAWHEYISEGPDKKLYIFIFATDSLLKYKGTNSMPMLCSEYKYLKLFEYSEEQLRKQNWLLEFKN